MIRQHCIQAQVTTIKRSIDGILVVKGAVCYSTHRTFSHHVGLSLEGLERAVKLLSSPATMHSRFLLRKLLILEGKLHYVAEY